MEPALEAAAGKRSPGQRGARSRASAWRAWRATASVHAAGVVISPLPLKELVPLYKTNKDEIVTQYDMSGLEKLGLLKMDFLGLTTLTIIARRAGADRAASRRGADLEEMPLDDQDTYRDLFAGPDQRRVPVRIARA